MNNSGYKTKHNWNTGEARSDVLGFYNHYFEKKAKVIAPEILMREEPHSDSASLMVIDMQNDFIYLPKGVVDTIPEEFRPPHFGRFCVQNGLSILQPLADFIDTNASKFTKIVYTRDAHPIDHCSFIPNGGPFPPHCVANHFGAALETTIKSVAEKHPENSVVIFKGCDTKVDSFGGIKYPVNTYGKSRQLGSCCSDMSDEDCMAHTGGRYMKDKTKGFEDYPFAGIGPYEDNSVDFLTVKANDCPKATKENIEANLGEEFKIEDLLGGRTSGTHTIYVVGLAADFCVKDTAMNLMKEIKARGGNINGVSVNVVVIQDLTRYVMLPLNLVAGGKTKKYTNIANTNKDIDSYLFQYTPTGDVRLLSQSEAAKANVAMANTGPDNKTPLAAFITPMNGILNDYKTTGVKVLIDKTPTLNSSKTNSGNTPPEMEGGRRHKNKTRKMSKKSCWPKMKGGKKTRKPMGHKKGCKCVVCRR